MTFATRPGEQAAQTQPTTTLCADKPVGVFREHRIKPELPSGNTAVTNLSPMQDMGSHNCDCLDHATHPFLLATPLLENEGKTFPGEEV